MSQEKASQLKEYADALERLEQWQASYSELTQDNEVRDAYPLHSLF